MSNWDSLISGGEAWMEIFRRAVFLRPSAETCLYEGPVVAT